MTIPEWTKSLAEALAAAGIASVVLAYLCRTILKLWLDKDLERFKSQLEIDSSREIDRFRAELSLTASQRQIQFATLHAKQAEIVAELYSRLEAVSEAITNWIRPVKFGNADMEKLRDNAITQFNELSQYYYPRAIWLDPAICNAIEGILRDLKKPEYDFMIATDDKGMPLDRAAWIEVWKHINEKVPPARDLLNTQFRQLLGVQVTPPVKPAPPGA